jgi:hypothetical protein
LFIKEFTHGSPADSHRDFELARRIGAGMCAVIVDGFILIRRDGSSTSFVVSDVKRKIELREAASKS